jgi:pimeloyl-ACP methyl ester carboxylesterase
MRNFIVRFPGKKDGVIVLATHYETNYPLRNINFVGANDGGSTTGLLMPSPTSCAGHGERGQRPARRLLRVAGLLRRRRGHSKLVGLRLDLRQPSPRRQVGTRRNLEPIKAFMLADMIGDKDLDIQRETKSTGWLVSLVTQAANKFGYDRYFFQTEKPSKTITCLRRARRAFDRRDRSRLRPQQQLPPHRPGHHGQDQRPQPDHRRRCVLEETIRLIERSFASLLAPILFNLPTSPVAIRHFLLGPNAPESLEQSVRLAISSVKPGVLAERLRAVLACDVRADLSKVVIPMLYIRATKDRLVHRNCLEGIQAILPRTAVVELDGPHLILQREPKQSAEVVTRFMRETL